MSDTDIINILSNYKNIHWNKLSNDIKTYLHNRFDDSESNQETWYRIKHNIIKRPVCKSCNEKIKFLGLSKGFEIFCSQFCKHKEKREAEHVKFNKEKIIDIHKDTELLEKYDWRIKEHIYPSQEDKQYARLRFPDAQTFKEVLFRLENNIEKRPSCIMCGCRVNYGYGKFSQYCSKSCISTSELTKRLVKISQKKKQNFNGEINDDIIKHLYVNRVYIHWNKEPENIVNYIKYRFNDSLSLEESFYRIKNNLEIRPICPICGKSLMFKIGNNLFHKFCSKKCSAISNETKEHRENSNLEKFGYTNPFQSPIVQSKISKTNQLLYGASNPFASEIIKEKIKETCIKKWGTEYPMQAECWRKFMSKRSSSKEFQEKVYATMKKNKTFGKSKIEDKIYEMIKIKFPNVKRHHKDFDKYPFYCDFYIPEINTWVEFQGYWSHGDHPFNPNDLADINRLNEMIKKSEKHPSYIGAISVWTKGDPYKREIAKQNKLNYIEFWNINEVKNWLNSI